MPLDPQVEIIIQEDAELGLPNYTELSPPQARQQMLDLSPPVDPDLSVTRVENLKIPYLIVQGSEDDVVLAAEAENLHKWNPKSELFFVDGMNHALGCIQPWKESKMPVHLEQTVIKSIEFIKK